MNERRIPFNMETHNITEWAERLKMNKSYLGKKLNAGESLFDIVRNFRTPKKNKSAKPTGLCKAKNPNECFNCKFYDCIRDGIIGGETKVIAAAIGEMQGGYAYEYQN